MAEGWTRRGHKVWSHWNRPINAAPRQWLVQIRAGLDRSVATALLRCVRLRPRLIRNEQSIVWELKTLQTPGSSRTVAWKG